ncbi:MAG: TetR/AcrR family transcriptional regulator [Pseudomonadota bacterium]
MTVASTRMGREHWVQIGLEALKSAEPEALTIERLCDAAGRTKGSFYHHFRGIEAYLEALLDAWEHVFTDQVIEQAVSEPGPKNQLMALDTLARLLDRDIEQGVRRLKSRWPNAAQRVARVDEKRIAFLQTLYAGLALPNLDAAALARVEYAAFLGFQQLDATVAGTNQADLYARYLSVILKRGAGTA